MQPEIVSLCEYSEAGPQWHQLVPRDAGRQLRGLLPHMAQQVVCSLKQQVQQACPPAAVGSPQYIF
jgi:hypothetical protein